MPGIVWHVYPCSRFSGDLTVDPVWNRSGAALAYVAAPDMATETWSQHHWELVCSTLAPILRSSHRCFVERFGSRSHGPKPVEQ
jgi:hypothetical protein